MLKKTLIVVASLVGVSFIASLIATRVRSED
jgi:hypothetical protein